MSNARIIRLLSDNFSFLTDLGGCFPPNTTWVNLGWEHLENFAAQLVEAGHEQAIVDEICGVSGELLSFAATACGDEFDDSDLLALKLDEEGMVAAIYGPGVFAGEDGEVVLKIGKNVATVIQDGDRFEVGGLPARLRFALQGEGTENEYTEVLLRVQGEDAVYVIKCVTPRGSAYTQDDIENALEAGDALANFLAPVPGGGGKFAKLKELPIGDYEIAAIVESTSQYCDFSIQLADGRTVDPNTYLKQRIGGQLANGVPLETVSKFHRGKLLRIKSVTEKGSRTIVDCAIVPKTQLGLAGGASKSKALPQAVQTEVVKPAPATRARGKKTATAAASDSADKFADVSI